MEIRVDVYHHFDAAPSTTPDPVLTEVLRIVRILQTQEGQIMLDLTKMQAAVNADAAADAAVMALLVSIEEELRAMAAADDAVDQAQLDTFADQVAAGAAALQAFTDSKTPGDPEEPPVDPEEPPVEEQPFPT